MSEPVTRIVPLADAGQAAGPPPFDRVGIVGLGLLGGSLALAVRRAWPSVLVVGVDRNAVLEEAQRVHAIDVAGDDLGMLADVDLCVLAAPVLENARLLGELPDVVSRQVVVTDVGSAKGVMEEAATRLPPRVAFIGGHPLAGAPRAGIGYASADLFRDRPWVLTPPPALPAESPALTRLLAFTRGLGAAPRVMLASEHDRLVSFIAQLPQLAASVLMRVIGDAVGPAGLALAGRGLRDTTRLASSPSHVWSDLCLANRPAIAAALDRLLHELKGLRDGLDDHEAVTTLFEEAAAWRACLESEPPPASST